MSDNAVIEKAHGYVGWPHLFHQTNLHVFNFMVRLGLKPEHKLLDVGAGCLGPGRYLSMYLDPCHYVVIEPNSEILLAGLLEIGDVVRARGIELHQFDDFMLTRAGPMQYDYVLAHSILTHASKQQALLIADQALKALKLGGIFAASYSWGGMDDPRDEWVYPAGVLRTDDFIQYAMLSAGFEKWQRWRPDETGHPVQHTWSIATKGQ